MCMRPMSCQSLKEKYDMTWLKHVILHSRIDSICHVKHDVS